MADEEGFIFILDDKRLVGFNSRAWDLYHLYDYNDTDIDSLLKNDSSDFFYKRIRNTK